MLKNLLPVIAAISIVGLIGRCEAKPSPSELRRSVVTLSERASGPSGRPICTGVAVAPHIVLTARHCVFQSFLGLPGLEVASIPYFNGWGCKTDSVIGHDGTDNVLVRTCVEFKHWAKMAKGSPEVGDPVQLWGHVLGLPLQYRRGYMSSKFIQPDGMMYPGSVVWMWDMQAAGGDSGGPFFNDKGEVMCVTSHGILRGHWPHFALVGCYPLKFTTEQLRGVK